MEFGVWDLGVYVCVLSRGVGVGVGWGGVGGGVL